MPEFVLDHGAPETARQFQTLDAFTQGYIEALFFTDSEPGTVRPDEESDSEDCNVWNPDKHSSLPGDVSFGDLAPEALARIIADCAAFQATNRALIDEASTRADYDESSAGRDFWFTRNGHGVGFWDRDQLEDNRDQYEALTAEMVAAGHNSGAWHAALAKRNRLKSNSLGERLSAAARAFPGVDSYVGDNGLVYVG